MDRTKLMDNLMKDNFSSVITLLSELIRRSIELELLMNEIKIILMRRSRDNEEQNNSLSQIMNQANEPALMDANNNDENRASTSMNETNSEHGEEIMCYDCMQTFKRGSGEFTRHLHNTTCKPYQCDVCWKLFKKKSNMVTHKLTHSKEVFPCDLCFAQFKCQKYLNNHIRRIHAKSEAPENTPIKREATAEDNEPSPKRVKYDSAASNVSSIKESPVPKSEIVTQPGSAKKVHFDSSVIDKYQNDRALKSPEKDQSATSSSDDEPEDDTVV